MNEKERPKVEDKKLKEDIIKIENFTPIASDGYRASPTSLFLDLENYLIISELSYAYGYENKIKKVGGEEIEEKVETIKPILLICRFNKQTKEKFYELKLLKTEDSLDVGNIKISLLQNTIAKTGIPTLMRFDTLKTIYTELNNEQVDVEKIYKKLTKIYQNYIFHRDTSFYSFLSIYTIATYFKELFDAFPILYFYGTFGCGKTRTLKILNCFCHRSYLWGSPTEATTFRFVDAMRGTLLVDNNVFRDSKELLNYLLGYKRDATIPRLFKAKTFRKESYEIEFFSPSTAYILNSTDSPDKFSSALLEQFLSRCISINLIKGEPNIKEDPRVEQFTNIREDLYRLRFQIFDRVYKKLKEVIDNVGLTGRQRELWLPIFTVASLISEDVLEEMKKYQKELTEEISESLYKREKIVIETIESLPCENGIYAFTTTELYNSIKKVVVGDDETGKEEREREFVRFWSLKSIGSLLKNLGFKRKSLSPKKKGYEISKSELEEMKRKYCPDMDRLDSLDTSSEHIQENQPSKFQENSQNTQNLESENTSICSYNLSNLSKVSTNEKANQYLSDPTPKVKITDFSSNSNAIKSKIPNANPIKTAERLFNGWREQYPKDYKAFGIPERELIEYLSTIFENPKEVIRFLSKNGIIYEPRCGFWKLVEDE